MPRSKWHSTLKSTQANQRPKLSTTALTTKTDQLKSVQQKQVQHATITITANLEKSKSIILMIHKPQQQEKIEIPLTNSMNLTRNNTKNQINQSQRTVVHIPQQNSKPRIFLLTKPSKSQLVQLKTPTAQPQYRKNSNSVQIHHPQKAVSVTPVTVAKQRLAETTRIPFLTRSQMKTLSMKDNQLNSKEANLNPILKPDLEINSVQYQNKKQVQEFNDQTLQEKPIILQEVVYPSCSLTETNCDQLPIQQANIKNTQTQSALNNLENKSKVIEPQAQTQSENPLTLSSMAGIELTGADISLSQADMSGAMPPTATVEEIKVPVFIDEYLQEATTSATSVTTNNIFNNNHSNTNNISNNSYSNEIGNEVNNFLDTLDNFEFDINMLTEYTGKESKTALEEKEDLQHLHQQQQLTGVDDDRNLKQHQLELQMMIEKMLLDNNSNNNSNNNNNNISNNYTTFNNNSNNINNINNMAGNIDITDDLFKFAPYTEINDFLSPDDLENSSFGTTQFNSEEAVDLNNISKDFSLDECFINSQPTEIMFSCGYSQSQSSSQNLINEISKAEPHIAIATTSEAAAIPMEECDLNDEIDIFHTSRYLVDNSIAECKKSKPLVSNHLKRHTSQISQHMLEKRIKLRLDTKICRENVSSQQTEMSTPKVIDFIDQFNDVTAGTIAVDSIKSIYNDLISSSPQCVSVKSEIIVDDITNDFSPPNTPYSVNSISNQTSFINTAPNSPASSIATTSNTSITTKRGRGRPAKTHSDIPDRSQIKHLSESEQRKLLERAKNNEASRKSRLKHKERDNALEREESELINRNLELQKEWKDWTKMENKLKAALKREYFQFQNDH